MNKISRTNENFEPYPHSPDVQDRETADNGFSKGLGLHFQPSEAYWLDCHNHLSEDQWTPARLYRALDECFIALDAYRLGRMVAIVEDANAFSVCQDVAEHDPRFGWLYRMPFDKPDPDGAQRALDCGALGIKLHNAPLMKGEADPEIWLGPEWSAVFAKLNQAGRAVLWHVTQRAGASPYHGGGDRSYWKDAKNGVKTSNEHLLQATWQVARKYPALSVIGAHQLHLGLDRLSVLFDEYPNLHIDTSCTFVLRWADDLYECDRTVLRQFFLKYSERILFGTDGSIMPCALDAYAVEAFLCHARFIRQLRLPDRVLQLLAHANAERVFKWGAMTPTHRGNIRP